MVSDALLAIDNAALPASSLRILATYRAAQRSIGPWLAPSPRGFDTSARSFDTSGRTEQGASRSTVQGANRSTVEGAAS
jgi:hypothetical protein